MSRGGFCKGKEVCENGTQLCGFSRKQGATGFGNNETLFIPSSLTLTSVEDGGKERTIIEMDWRRRHSLTDWNFTNHRVLCWQS